MTDLKPPDICLIPCHNRGFPFVQWCKYLTVHQILEFSGEKRLQSGFICPVNKANSSEGEIVTANSQSKKLPIGRRVGGRYVRRKLFDTHWERQDVKM